MSLEIKDDFYKRFGRSGGIAESVSCPASVCLFGGTEFGAVPEMGLKLSFGCEAAYRSRSDDRIVLSRTDSDTRQSVNRIDMDDFRGTKWAREIMSALKKIPLKSGGAEILLHADTGMPALSPRLLCAVYAGAKLLCEELTPQAVVRASGYPPFYLTSLIPDSRIAIVNNTTLEYLCYPLKLPKRKIVVIKLLTRSRKIKTNQAYAERERNRINMASNYLVNGDVDGFGRIMYEAGRDMLGCVKSRNAEALLEFTADFSKTVRILPDLTGAVAVIPDDDVDEFVMIVGDRYEKKTGNRPAFYISD